MFMTLEKSRDGENGTDSYLTKITHDKLEALQRYRQ